MSSASWHRLLYPGLLLFGASLPLSKSASSILVVALCLAACVGAWRSREFRDDLRRSCRQPLTAALALFSLVAYAGIIHTEVFADGFAVANKFVSLPVIYVLVSLLLESNRDEETINRKATALLVSFLIGLTALDLVGAATFLGLTGAGRFATPLSPLGMHHIWFSNINAIGLYTAAALLLFPRRGAAAKGRLALLAFLPLAALCILLSTSRTAWFGIVLTAAILAAVMIRKMKPVLFLGLFSLLACALTYQFVPLVHERIDTMALDLVLFAADQKPGSSIGDRLFMWRAALLMFQQGPVIGIGTGDYYPAVVAWNAGLLLPDSLMAFNQPHNMYLFSLATNGLVGLAALLYIFYRSLACVVPIVRADGGGNLFAFLALATVAHFMIAGFFDSFFHIQILRYSFAFIMGVCLRSSANRPRRP